MGEFRDFWNSKNRVLNAAKPGHSADPVSAVTKKDKTLLGVEYPIGSVLLEKDTKP